MAQQQSPLERRIHPAPPAVISLALKRNLANGVAIMPRPAATDHPLIPALRRMLAELPDAVLELAREHVAAIYLVQGNFGSARVEAARDSQGSLIGGCMLLNLDALARSANAWASWREGSAFHSDDRYRIQVTLERPQNDDIEHSLRFVFLHELGHILGMAARVHGFWAAPETWPITVQSPFTRLLNSPFRVDVYRGRKKLTEYRSCLDTGRCPGKRVFIERFFTAQSEVEHREDTEKKQRTIDLTGS